jgi:glutamate synthase (NADPH/NADH) small chain
VLGISDEPVTIEKIELQTIEHAYDQGLPVAQQPLKKTTRRIAVVGSGPAGLAVAAQLTTAGHSVTVFERSDKIGGLLRYGIPEFKMEKGILDRRLSVMEDLGVIFRSSTLIGRGGIPISELQRNFDAVALCIGSTRPRLIDVPGSELVGVFPAMSYLEASMRALQKGMSSDINAEDLNVVILGGGDTGADCLGTAHRQGAKSVTQIEIMDEPPLERPLSQPWPTMARLFKITSAHEEGGTRVFSSETLKFLGDNYLTGLEVRDNQTGVTTTVDADLVLIAAGFVGPELTGLGLDFPEFKTPKQTLAVGFDWKIEEYPGETPVFACGDAVRGQSLIVWAIAEGRACAAAIDAFLNEGQTSLPSPIKPYEISW